MAGARAPILVLVLWSARWTAAGQQMEDDADMRQELGNANSLAGLLRLLAPTDSRLCDEEVLQQLEEDSEGDVTADKEELASLRAVCNATRFLFPRGFPRIADRTLEPSSNVTPQMLRVMERLFKKAIPKARCKARATIVPLQPTASRFFYLPSCVSVKRCSGCCDLDIMSCVPSVTRSAKKQVIVIDVVSSVGASLKSVKPIQVEEHVKCKCAL